MKSTQLLPVDYGKPGVVVPREVLEPIAKRSLIAASLFFLTPIPCLIAIVLGITGIERTRCKGTRGVRQARWGLISGLLGLAAWIVAFQILQHHSSATRQAGVAADLARFGQTLMLYQNDNKNRYPESHARLFAENMDDYNVPASLVSPTLGDTPASGSTPAAARKDFEAGGHSSFVLIAGDYEGYEISFGLHLPPKDLVIAFNAYDVDGKVHYTILYADGRVIDCERMQGQQIIQQRIDQIIAKYWKEKERARDPEPNKRGVHR